MANTQDCLLFNIKICTYLLLKKKIVRRKNNDRKQVRRESKAIGGKTRLQG